MKNADKPYILCNRMFIVFKFRQLKNLHCAFYSAIIFVHIRDFIIFILERSQ